MELHADAAASGIGVRVQSRALHGRGRLRRVLRGVPAHHRSARGSLRGAGAAAPVPDRDRAVRPHRRGRPPGHHRRAVAPGAEPQRRRQAPRGGPGGPRERDAAGERVPRDAAAVHGALLRGLLLQFPAERELAS